MENRITPKILILGLQHVFAMFGACVLVPLLTGLDPAVALFGAGVGTLIFHFVTKKRVPVFLASSFAFITAIQVVGDKFGLQYAQGGIIVAGIMYLVFALIVKLIGTDRIKKLFPPVVTGSMIIVIGLTLAPSVINANIVNATVGTPLVRWLIAFIVVATMVIVSIFAKGFFKLVPILFGIIVGYIASLLFGIVDFTPVQEAMIFQIPKFTLPLFNLESIMLIAPLSIVTCMEHIGDITTSGNATGNDFISNPGLHRTLIGDGIATSIAGLIGAPANTTYSENTGVLAVTKMYNPFVLRVAAVIAILLSFIGKFGSILQTIPAPVMGGISIVLFGMIASIGIRTMVDARVNFADSKNMLICAVMLALGLSGVALGIGIIQLTGMSLAAVVGIILNIVLKNE